MTEAFRTWSLGSTGYPDYELQGDHKPLAGSPDPNKSRRKKRQSETQDLDSAPEFHYDTVADGDAFRVAVLQPGSGSKPVSCSLIWQDSKKPQKPYRCLSYAWESTERTEAIFLNGFQRFPVTQNLLRALQSLRDSRSTTLIWVDQICIDQSNDKERGHQVNIMKHIFNQARMVYVWLGEAGSGTQQLFAFAKRIAPGDDSLKKPLKQLISQKKLKDALEDLLQRPWFQRVWVIPEVALSRYTQVMCGEYIMTWDSLVKLIRYVQIRLPTTPGFAKQESLLGNRRQRIAIITQMIASQKECRDHTDIAQLLILAKSSRATDVHDMVYAFQGLTYLTTFPDYSRGPVSLFGDTVQMYANSIQWTPPYAKCHQLSEEQKIFQLMSIIYSAGALQQDLSLPSFVPDWSCPWRLAPIWCKPEPNFVNASKDEWSLGIRTDYRAGGDHQGDFEVIERPKGRHLLRISALILDEILLVTEHPTPDTSQILSTSPVLEDPETPDSSLEYGRNYFTSAKGYNGLATEGVAPGDQIAILPGGDVPIIIRPNPENDRTYRAYRLLCECYVQSSTIMYGDYLRSNWTLCEDIIFI
ncbi:hypothetical protein M409DRAFT_63361 [Zasmidium cellare ATCC 36951]|uniref:Heterokaryon incompatibility domain-containing protein n=1 Tax=Zasmidium cellare ATCC 36951 TaxID=1080233 RepID=A0A6A6D027_ZASCE|nr:uncharacterized protein M409DRAFT_63361 [Zasmidium cellare ATCC 36951]KAF2171768.1 hypothetical protein M409DRAFT_63361 [Zasmidium cellare ATCC 36951]